MTKFTDKAMTGFPMAFYYAAMKAMDDRYFCFVCWPCTMPVSRHSCEEPYFRLI